MNTTMNALKEIKNNEGRYVDFEDLYKLDDWKNAVIIFKEGCLVKQPSLANRCYLVTKCLPHFKLDRDKYPLLGTNFDFSDMGAYLEFYIHFWGIERVYIYD